MTAKRSIWFFTSFAFFIGFTIFTFSSYYFDSTKYYDDYVERKSQLTVNYLKLSQSLLTANLREDLGARLEDAIAQRSIDFYIVKNGDTVTAFSTPTGELSNLPQEAERKNEILFYENLALGQIEHNEQSVMIGFYHSEDAYMTYLFSEQGNLILRDLAIVVLLFLCIFFYFMKDIISILRLVKRRTRKKEVQNINFKYKESQLLAKSFFGYEKSVDALGRKAEMFKNQVLPGLRSEVTSGKQPPYSFDCVLVRLDINNFTNIFTNYPVEPFMDQINDYFKSCVEIVERYRGYIYEFIGDEVIFYFKKEDVENPAAMAVAALRDLNLEADKINEMTEKEHGYSFHVKSSLSLGALRFGKQVNAYTLAGGVFIESVRILSHVDEKMKNTINFGHSVAQNLESFTKNHIEKSVELKGISGQFDLYTVDSILPIESALKKVHEKDLSLIPYYRRDDHILKIFEFLSKNHESLDNGTLNQIFANFRDIQIQAPNSEVLGGFLKLLSELVKHSSNMTDIQNPLATLISCGSHLIHGETESEALFGELETIIETHEGRTVANALELLSHFKSENITQDIFGRKNFSKNNRILANSLIKLGQDGLSSQVISKLKKMLKSEEDLHIASGIYALRVLIEYYIQEDLVYLQTQSEFLSLKDVAKKQLTRESASIHKQFEILDSVTKELDAKVAA